MTQSLFLALILAPLLQAQHTPLVAVEKLFEAVIHKDAATATALFTPDAMLYALRSDGTAAGMPAVKWIERMAASKDQWQERIYNPSNSNKAPSPTSGPNTISTSPANSATAASIPLVCSKPPQAGKSPASPTLAKQRTARRVESKFTH